MMCRFDSLASEHAQRWRELPEGARKKGSWQYVGGEGKTEAGVVEGGSGGSGSTGKAAEAEGGKEEYEYYCDITDAKIDVKRDGRYHYG